MIPLPSFGQRLGRQMPALTIRTLVNPAGSAMVSPVGLLMIVSGNVAHGNQGVQTIPVGALAGNRTNRIVNHH